ncbi:MAG: YchJ family protein [Burkholderiaceae bacterium]
MTARGKALSDTPGCPCGGASYAGCCGRYLDGGMPAPTAEALMRSRYTAFVRRDERYLRKTWCAATRPAGPLFDEPAPQWLGLSIVGAQEDGDAATVEFVARYKINGRAHRLHEVSRFRREAEPDVFGGAPAWRYLDGAFR